MNSSVYRAVLTLTFALASNASAAKQLRSGEKPTTGNHNNNLTSSPPQPIAIPYSCQDISRIKMPPFKLLIDIGTLAFDLTTDTLFDDTSVMFVNKAQSHSGYTGNIIVADGDRFITFKSSFGEDHVNTTNCNTGQNVTWFAHSSESSPTGTYLCIFSCDGDALQNFVCASNNPKYITQESLAVAAVQNVPGVKKLHNARTNNHKVNKHVPNCHI